MWVIQLPAHDEDTPPTQALSSNQPIACSAINQTTNDAIANPAPKQAIACSAIEHKTKANLVTFLHAACFSPARSTSSQPSKLAILPLGPDSLPNSLPNTYPSPSHPSKAISISNTKMYTPPSQPRQNLLLDLFLNA
jgi:hypothetical protein